MINMEGEYKDDTLYNSNAWIFASSHTVEIISTMMHHLVMVCFIPYPNDKF